MMLRNQRDHPYLSAAEQRTVYNHHQRINFLSDPLSRQGNGLGMVAAGYGPMQPELKPEFRDPCRGYNLSSVEASYAASHMVKQEPRDCGYETGKG